MNSLFTLAVWQKKVLTSNAPSLDLRLRLVVKPTFLLAIKVKRFMLIYKVFAPMTLETIVLSVLGVTRYLCNDIITFVVTKYITKYAIKTDR